MAFFHGDLAQELGKFTQELLLKELLEYPEIRFGNALDFNTFPNIKIKTYGKKFSCGYNTSQDEIVRTIRPDMLVKEIAEQFYIFSISKASELVLPVPIKEPIVNCYVEPMNYDYSFHFRIPYHI